MNKYLNDKNYMNVFIRRINKKAWKKGYYSWYNLPKAITTIRNKLNVYYNKCITSYFLNQPRQTQQIILHQYHNKVISKPNSQLIFDKDVVWFKKKFDKHSTYIELICNSCNERYVYDKKKSSLWCPNCKTKEKNDIMNIHTQIKYKLLKRYMNWMYYKHYNNNK